MKKKTSLIIAVDVDGTIVTHEYPLMGKDIGAADVLKKIVNKGHKLMLWTMRDNKPEGTQTLKNAVQWFKNNDIPLWGINENPAQKVSGWSTSNKQYADLFIDDAALGAPLMYDANISAKPFINWVLVEKLLTEMKII